MSSPSGSAWTAGQVASHLGISESTLRTWHRRYGLDPRDAEPGHYRRYREEDVARLRRMVELITMGMLASEAARVVQSDEPGAVPLTDDVAAVVAAARALDTQRCGALLDSVLARRGVADTWQLVCCPALLAVDEDQRTDPECVDVEHALSWAMLAALHRVPRPPSAPGAPFVVLACTEDEQHTLPLVALSAALGEHGVPARMLGAATPTASIARAVRETRPDAIVLWAQRPDTARSDVLEALRPYPVRPVIAGPGWGAGVPSSPGAARVTSLAEALTVLTSDPRLGRDRVFRPRR